MDSIRVKRRLPLAPLPIAAFLAIVGGASARLLSSPDLAFLVWSVALIATGAPVVVRTAAGVLRGRFAADLIAALAILTAILLREPLAGLIVVLMQTGGEALERYAERRASDALRALEEAVPATAHRSSAGRVEDIPADAVLAGDTLLVRPGEMIPCDGVVIEGRSHVDASRISGESVPLSAAPGMSLMSGSINGEGALVLHVVHVSRESQYARIVHLVRTAQAQKAPLQRVADRYAVWFTPITLAMCVIAWLLSGDATRVLAVLVVATPCPLILATPVAIVGGINRAAKRHIIMRDGGALERLETVNVAVLDKTGTLTIGRPRVATIRTAPEFTQAEVLGLAGAVEQGSSHILARTLVEAATERGIELPSAESVQEAPGQGVSGTARGRRIAVGSRAWITGGRDDLATAFGALNGAVGGLRAWVTIDGRAAAIVTYDDAIRPELRHFLDDLRALGIQRTLMLSGDHADHTHDVARRLGITEARGDMLPEDKVAVVRDLVARGNRVLMVGDGTNDAPALAAATVGVALAAHGGGISAEAADVVLLIDDPARATEAIRIGRRTMRIARQSIRIGLGLSATAMIVAGFGYIPPIAGALLQELIDVAVILNALRASIVADQLNGV
jgi:heavy metal translocating P-type ATPase